MRAWLFKRILDHNMTCLNAGDPGPQLRFIGQDSHLRFPGDSSWGRDYRGKDEVRGFLERFARAGLQIFADEVVVSGPPWRTTICIRGTDHLRTPAGELVYENRYVIWGHGSWLKLMDYEVYEDTQKVGPLDEYLERREQAAPA